MFVLRFMQHKINLITNDETILYGRWRKDKQDNALSEHTKFLGDLEGMWLDIGSEIDWYVLHRLQFTICYFSCPQGEDSA